MSQTPLALVGTEIGAAVDAKADLNAAVKDRLYGGIMSLVEWRVWECLTGRKKQKNYMLLNLRSM